MKNFDEWSILKKEIEKNKSDFNVDVREIWWVSLGVNIGSETCGKNENFERPVLVLKKFDSNNFFVLPITSTIKNGDHFYKMFMNGQDRCVMLHQGKFLNKKRFLRRVQILSETKFDLVKKSFIELIDSGNIKIENPPKGGNSQAPYGGDISIITKQNILSNGKIVTYNKLVRDKMTDIWDEDKKRGEVYSDISYKYVNKEEILEKLKDKIHEETKEVMEAYDEKDKNHLKEELGDLIEVIDAILYHNNISLDEVLKMRDIKKEKRGGFEKGLYLEWVEYIDENNKNK